MTRRLEARQNKPFTCDTPGCDKTFSSVQNRDRHRRGVHSLYKADDKVHFCALCGEGEAWPRIDSLVKHLEKMHSKTLCPELVITRRAVDCGMKIYAGSAISAPSDKTSGEGETSAIHAGYGDSKVRDLSPNAVHSQKAEANRILQG
jgi:hypothetical protein